jgi:hypothetical protein
MEYSDFINCIRWTQDYWSRRRSNPKNSYSALHSRGNNYWLHLENLTVEQIDTDIIRGFLNTREWNCHLPQPPKPDGVTMVGNLHLALNKNESRYSRLQHVSLDNLDVSNIRGLTDINDIYKEFRNIRPKFGPVASSKLMHMALPDLFMMWDNAIIKAYLVPTLNMGKKRFYSYLYFLLEMQENLNHIQMTFPGLGNVVNAIDGHFGYTNFSLTRLLDIANYAVTQDSHWKGSPYYICRECSWKASSKTDILQRKYPSLPIRRLG